MSKAKKQQEISDADDLIDLKPDRWFDYKTVEKGTIMVTKGEYVGTTEGQFGARYRFRELDSQETVVLDGGALKYKVEQGDIHRGGVYRITWEGREKMTKGKFAGKETNAYLVQKFKPAALEGYDLEATREATPDLDTVAKEANPKSSDLDDLE